MTSIIQDVLVEAKRNRYADIWNSLTDTDVLNIWESVSASVIKNMEHQKGVSISGLGTFAFTQLKLDIGPNKVYQTQRPVFQLSEKLVLMHRLQQKKYLISGGLPVVPLNLAHLSMESNGSYDRDTIDSCIREVLSALSRCIADNRPVEFAFNGIGRLLVRDSRVKMKFYKSFVRMWDGSGKMIDSLQGRPTTADSVMSELNTTRSRPSSVIPLPKAARDENGSCTLEPIVEDAEEIGVKDEQLVDEADADEGCDVLTIDHEEPETTQPAATSVDDHRNADNNVESAVEPEDRRTVLSVPQVNAISFTDDLPAAMVTPDSRLSTSAHGSTTSRQQSCPLLLKRRSVTSVDGERDWHHSRSITRSVELTGGAERLTPPSTAGSSVCEHSDAGQELCYLCYQRANNNIPISFADERRRRADEEDRLLRDFLLHRDAVDMQTEQDKLLAKRQETQKTAAYNCATAAEAASSKAAAAKDTSFRPSFVFHQRAWTPPQFIKQENYQKDLEQQIAARDEAEKKKKTEENLLGHLEQVQLAQELTAQRDQYLRTKADRTEAYKRALSAQIKMKMKTASANAPSRSPEPLYFATDFNERDAALVKKRQRASELFREQLALVEQRKRDAVMKSVQRQQLEEDVLSRSKQELIADSAERYERLLNNRRHLEDNWKAAMRRKADVEAEERRSRTESGSLLLDQCSQVKRCGQCRRRLDNRGQTNVWCETRYVPGCRIMV